MTKKKTTKKALLASALSLLLCFSMLLGTTYAWFTDSVTSANNIIKSGNLDITLEYYDGDSWETVEASEDILTGDLWEPGYVDVAYLRIKNAGSLALKYNLGVNIVSETPGVNKAGESFKLSDYIYYDVEELAVTDTAPFAPYASREAAMAIATEKTLISAGYSKSGTLLPTDGYVYLAMVVYMPTTVDNVANHNGKDVPQINLGINVMATQLAAESDSFGTDYDADAPWMGGVDTAWYFADPDATTFTLSTAEELAGFAAIVNGTASATAVTFAAKTATTVHDDFAGQTVKLGADLDLSGIDWTPIGRIGASSTDFTYAFRGTFDGQNHTVSNLDVNTDGWAGFFGIAYKADIKNLKIDGASIRANRMAGTVVGQLYGSIDNCHAEDIEIIVTPNAVGESYDNGDKVGGIVGWIGDNGNNRTLTNCSVNAARIGAYRDVGGIAGYVAYSTTISGNKVDNLEITVDQTTHFYGEKDPNAGAIWGRNSVSSTGVGVTDENNTQGEEITIVSTVSKGGLTYKNNGVTNEITLYLVPADYEGTTVNVADGTTNIGGYAFAYNSNIEKIVLPSTVTTLNDRAFRDTSASTVVLNEGLTNISYQAFRNASNLKTVEIPSTVTTISKEAFQNSGIEELVIPANVTTIEYGGLRDMKSLVSVTIEGNVDIPVYAFRACTKLRTVILKGDNVTFGGGSRGMIFTNKENGDGSAITVLVENETVKERLLAADTAAKDYGGYTIIVGADKVVSDPAELTEALQNANPGDTIILLEDVKSEAATTAPYGNKYAFKLDGGVLDGNGNELYMECYGDDYGIMTSGGTVKNITIKEGCRAIMIMYPTADIILDNVNIGGDGVLYPINTGEKGADNVNLIVTNSTLAGWTSFSNIESATFTNVKFEQGTYYNNIYGRVLKPYVNTTLTNCSFVEHMNLDLSGLVEGQKVTFTNCTVNGQAVTAGVFTIPTTDAEYDTELFTVDLPSWATSIEDCVVFS
ncbi:MAG: leucine-rich repeat domain-containing protein [Clostridia bacterium]|nr:leucine-rich repeat domain-containing protein [Clostridia bacterium]